MIIVIFFFFQDEKSLPKDFGPPERPSALPRKCKFFCTFDEKNMLFICMYRVVVVGPYLQPSP